MAAKKKAKQADLPGMENREIKELNDAAEELRCGVKGRLKRPSLVGA